MRDCNTVEFFGFWEELHNKNFNRVQFEAVRDAATLNQLLVLANMESYNAVLIEQGRSQSERLVLLHNLAVRQMQTLAAISMDNLPQLPNEVK